MFGSTLVRLQCHIMSGYDMALVFILCYRFTILTGRCELNTVVV